MTPLPFTVVALSLAAYLVYFTKNQTSEFFELLVGQNNMF